ncbi:MAG TPA: BMP family ABC transporter substrate-binding protein [Streptosporangiaceae bacterium]|nr:BMP family ABC transporter substrate-binding protein [Streptosporangiaceae bacterium]
MKYQTRAALAALLVPALLVTGCAKKSSGTTAQNGAPAASKGHQPDVNGDGKVVIGIMSPGDTHDHGYYESFVDEANTFAQQNSWKVITVDKINPSEAVNQARNLCRQHVDLIAIGASELKDALTAAPEPVCQGVNWYISAGVGVVQTPYFAQSKDFVNESLYAAGYAAGLILKQNGGTKAGYITGPELDFSKQAAKAYAVGLKAVVPSANVITTYTGDFNDSAKAKEAATAQLAKGVKVLYPYLGGATDAVTALANAANVPVLTPGTDRCTDPTAKYAVSVIFSPGAYFAASLQDFKAGTLKMGQARAFHLGKDEYPTVKICQPQGDQQQQLNQVMQDVGSGKINVDAVIGAAK